GRSVTVVQTCALPILPLVSVLCSVLSKGLPTLISHPALLVTDMHSVVGATDIATQDAGASLQGGILHGLVGTVLITVLASAISRSEERRVGHVHSRRW